MARNGTVSRLEVQGQDFAGSRPLFADNLITFGTYAAFTLGRAATEKEQWRKVWSHINGFRWRLDDLRTIVSSDRLTGGWHGGVRVQRVHRSGTALN
ncbi:hypothetical protein JQC81_01570 [Microvirga arabica]|nr:hypothetical protein [Microvirga arabica]